MAISPKYYQKSNTVRIFFEGRRPHYLQKERIIVVDKYAYELKYGEDMYSLAIKIFGNTNPHLWTIIADINELRKPMDWFAGETVFLPLVIVNESIVEIRKFADEQSLTSVL